MDIATVNWKFAAGIIGAILGGLLVIIFGLGAYQGWFSSSPPSKDVVPQGDGGGIHQSSDHRSSTEPSHEYHHEPINWRARREEERKVRKVPPAKILTVSEFSDFFRARDLREFVTWSEEDVEVVRANVEKTREAEIPNPIFGTSTLMEVKDMENCIKDWDMRDEVIKILRKDKFSETDITCLYSLIEKESCSSWDIPKPIGTGNLTSADLVTLVLPQEVKEVWDKRERLKKEVLDRPDVYEELEATQRQLHTMANALRGLPSQALFTMIVYDGTMKDLDLTYWGGCLLLRTRNPTLFAKNLAVLKRINPNKYRNTTIDNLTTN